MKTVAEEIREATQAGHAMMKDLRALMRECRDEADRIESAAVELVQSTIDRELKVALDGLGEKMAEWSNDIYVKVIEEAYRAQLIAVHGDEHGEGVSIFEMVRLMRERVEFALSTMLEEGGSVAVPEDISQEAAKRYRKTFESKRPPQERAQMLNRKQRRKLARNAAKTMASDPQVIREILEEDGG